MPNRAPEERGLKIRIWPEGGFPEKARPREVAVLSCWGRGRAGLWLVGRGLLLQAHSQIAGWPLQERAQEARPGPGPGWAASSPCT